MNINIKIKRWLNFRTAQHGAAAVEMAIVFPLLFSVTYATVVYGYIFYIQQALNRMAEEALRSAVRIDPTTTNYSGALDAAADASVTFSKNNTPIIASNQIATTHSLNLTPPTGGPPIYTVSLVLATSALRSSGFASISLPFGFGAFPPLPVNLTATAVAQVN